jgi:hypothetical protein
VEHAITLATGLLGEGTRQVGLADAGCAVQDLADKSPSSANQNSAGTPLALATL